MIEEIRERLSEVVADHWTANEVTRAVDEAIRRFAHAEKWPWLYTVQGSIPVASGNAEVELIDDVVFTRHFNLGLVPDAGTQKLLTPRRVGPAEGFRLRALYYGQTGEPQYYYVARTITNSYDDVTGSPNPDEWAPASIVTLVPTPDQAYTAEVHYMREPAALTDTTEPDIPAPYQEAIVARATGALWLKEHNMGHKAQEQFNIYNDVLEQARRDMKGMAIDETVVWGRSEPEYPQSSDRLDPRLPLNLG